MTKKSEVIEVRPELSELTPDQLLVLLSHAHLSRILSINPKGITTEVVHSEETKKIVLPEGMGLQEAAKELTNMHKNLEQEVTSNTSFDGYDWKDSLHAIKMVSEKEFGWLDSKSNPYEIEVLVNVVNGKEQVEKCFYGTFRVAAWEAAVVEVDISRDGTVSLSVTSKKKYTQYVTQYFEQIREHLATQSIFRGKTVVVTGQSSPFGTSIDYQIIENLASDPIILNENEQLQLDNFVLGDLDQPGKKSYLFTGAYGNGKTETAMEIGRKANEMGMPFFYVKDAILFERVLVLAQKYQPCVIFQEDLDETAAGAERDERINKIINTLDGTETKGRNITVIFTTNHVERINPALRRPGRIDLVLEFTNPTDETKIDILKRYLKDQSGLEDIDFASLLPLVGDVSGSVVAQMGKRAKKLAVRQGKTTTSSVKAAIVSMGPQVRLMSDGITEPSKAEKFASSFTDLLQERLVPQISKMGKR